MPRRGEPSAELDQGDELEDSARSSGASPVWRPGRRAPRVGVIGSSGSGKTTLMKSIVYSWLDEVPNARFLVWDPTIEWGERHENLHVFPSHKFTLAEVCSIALELEDCTVVADEIDQECDSKAGLLRGDPIHTIVNYGRHHNVGLLWGARRAADVPRGLTANTGKLFVLLTSEPSDIEWLDKKTGRDGTASRAQDLEPGEWFLWQAGRRPQPTE